LLLLFPQYTRWCWGARRSWSPCITAARATRRRCAGAAAGGGGGLQPRGAVPHRHAGESHQHTTQYRADIHHACALQSSLACPPRRSCARSAVADVWRVRARWRCARTGTRQTHSEVHSLRMSCPASLYTVDQQQRDDRRVPNAHAGSTAQPVTCHSARLLRQRSRAASAAPTHSLLPSSAPPPPPP
jgi:hypothetical protein